MIWTACVIKAQGTNLQLLYVEYWCASSNTHILSLTWNSAIMPDERCYWLVSYYPLLKKVCNKCNGFKCVDPIADIPKTELCLMVYGNPCDSDICINPWPLTPGMSTGNRSRDVTLSVFCDMFLVIVMSALIVTVSLLKTLYFFVNAYKIN